MVLITCASSCFPYLKVQHLKSEITSPVGQAINWLNLCVSLSESTAFTSPVGQAVSLLKPVQPDHSLWCCFYVPTLLARLGGASHIFIQLFLETLREQGEAILKGSSIALITSHQKKQQQKTTPVLIASLSFWVHST